MPGVYEGLKLQKEAEEARARARAEKLAGPMADEALAKEDRKIAVSQKIDADKRRAYRAGSQDIQNNIARENAIRQYAAQQRGGLGGSELVSALEAESMAEAPEMGQGFQDGIVPNPKVIPGEPVAPRPVAPGTQQFPNPRNFTPNPTVVPVDSIGKVKAQNAALRQNSPASQMAIKAMQGDQEQNGMA